MKHLTGLALILGTVLPATAFAGGLAQPVVEPVLSMPAPPLVVAPNGDWTGLYAGAALGVGYMSASNGTDGHDGIAGLNLGYRKDFGQMVLGGELSYSQNDVGQDSAGSQILNTSAAKVMLGLDMGRTLVYMSGGVTQADIRVSGATASDNGYFGGIGMDYAVDDKWTVGGEVIASRYDDFNGTGVNIEDTALQLKVGYRF